MNFTIKVISRMPKYNISDEEDLTDPGTPSDQLDGFLDRATNKK